MPMMICFDVASLYYLPQYTPVAHALRERGQHVVFVLRGDGDPVLMDAAEASLSEAGWDFIRLAGAGEALDWYKAQAPRWILFGNGCQFLNQLPRFTRTALLYHGIGVKSCYYGRELSEFSVRFSEGAFRTEALQRLFPKSQFIDVGFAKLDPLLQQPRSPHVPDFDLVDAGLDPSRATVLYAPTYYPSSIECLPKTWPAELSDVNIIIKPHMLTWASLRYANQQRRLREWAKYPNVYVAGVGEFSLLPYMAVGDVLVSEASSAIFEFAALDKPIVWCDFYRLRWAYRGPLSFRHTRRMDQTILGFKDVGAHARDATELSQVVRQELANPTRHALGRARCSGELIGRRDGLASERIAAHLLAT